MAFLKQTMQRYLLFVSKVYSFEILRPLQSAIKKQNNSVAWFIFDDTLKSHLAPDETLLSTIEDVLAFSPQAVFTPGNWVPDFFPGVKVQVFHGFGIDKKGHFKVRNHFDLYCTHGPLTTHRFNQLALQHPHFSVIETGWPKVDPIFNHTQNLSDKRQVLYAPTFSPAFSSAKALLSTIHQLSQNNDWQWLIKFHPKQDTETIKKYKDIQSDTLKVSDATSILPLMQQSHVLLTDTSSVISEFMLLDKPVITFNGSDDSDKVFNITQISQLKKALDSAFNSPEDILLKQKTYIDAMHPYRDGMSSERVLDAVNHFKDHLKKNLEPKPLNFFRRLKLRLKMHYFKW